MVQPLNVSVSMQKKLKISSCKLDQLEHLVGSTKPAIKYYICEMNKTFTAPDQRLVRALSMHFP